MHGDEGLRDVVSAHEAGGSLSRYLLSLVQRNLAAATAEYEFWSVGRLGCTWRSRDNRTNDGDGAYPASSIALISKTTPIAVPLAGDTDH